MKKITTTNTLPTPKKLEPKKVAPTKTTRSELVKLIKGSGGRFITVDFSTKKEPNRVMNCMYPRHKSAGAPAQQLGYVTVIAPKQGYKNVNTRTLKSAKIGGVVYTV